MRYYLDLSEEGYRCLTLDFVRIALLFELLAHRNFQELRLLSHPNNLYIHYEQIALPKVLQDRTGYTNEDNSQAAQQEHSSYPQFLALFVLHLVDRRSLVQKQYLKPQSLSRISWNTKSVLFLKNY